MKERKKEDHEGCFQGTLFVQGTTKTLVIKGALVERDNGWVKRKVMGTTGTSPHQTGIIISVKIERTSSHPIETAT